MRRLLVAGCLAALLTATGCGADGDGDNGGAAAPSGDDNTAQVCAEAESVQAHEIQQFDQEINELQEQDLDQAQFEQAALQSMERAVTGWSDGLAAQAGRADNPELAEALQGLSDGLADAAPKLTVESVRTGEIPGAEQLDRYGETLTRLCRPDQAPPTP